VLKNEDNAITETKQKLEKMQHELISLKEMGDWDAECLPEIWDIRFISRCGKLLCPRI